MYNNPMINQLLRNREQIDTLINQYNQPTPIQNFINTTGLDFEAKILTNGEDLSNIMIQRRTLFVDEKNHKVVVKEMDGKISKEYDIIVPKDEKDLKIEALENKLNEMEMIINERNEPIGASSECKQPNVNVNGYAKPKPKANVE